MRRNEDLVEAYLQRLEREAYNLYEQYPNKLKTIYFGGGTPSHLNNSELERIVSFLKSTWGFDAAEISFEADPLSFDRERLIFFKDLGINRLSIGLQSSQDDSLKFLGRLHNASQGMAALGWALEAGFSVSADIITAVPGQLLEQDVLALATSGVQHISAYSLTIEANTAFGLRNISIDEDKAADDILLSSEILQRYSFKHYEVSNFAKEGFESEHNKNYWQGGYYLALGPSAVSFLPAPGYLGNRRSNDLIKNWLKEKGQKDYFLDKEEYFFDLLFTALRTSDGLDLDFVFNKTSIDVKLKYADLLNQLFELGWLELTQSKLLTTELGKLYINTIVKRFIESSK